MRNALIEKFKKFKKLCKELGKSKEQVQKKKARGRPKKKLKENDTDNSWSLYDYKKGSYSSIEVGDDTSDDDMDDNHNHADHNQIPKEIQWYESFDVKGLDHVEIMRNPLLFYKRYGKSNLFYFEQIAKWALINQLTSVGAEAIFNDCGNTRTDRRTTLDEQLATDIDAIQKWVRSFGIDIETYDNANE